MKEKMDEQMMIRFMEYLGRRIYESGDEFSPRGNVSGNRISEDYMNGLFGLLNDAKANGFESAVDKGLDIVIDITLKDLEYPVSNNPDSVGCTPYQKYLYLRAGEYAEAYGRQKLGIKLLLKARSINEYDRCNNILGIKLVRMLAESGYRRIARKIVEENLTNDEDGIYEEYSDEIKDIVKQYDLKLKEE